MTHTRTTILSLVLEANDDGYLASVPGLQGAFAEGDTSPKSEIPIPDSQWAKG